MRAQCCFDLQSLTSFSFLKQHLGASGPETADVEALKLEVSELRQKVEQLQETNTELKTKVQYLKSPQNSDTRIIAVIILKFDQGDFTT